MNNTHPLYILWVTSIFLMPFGCHGNFNSNTNKLRTFNYSISTKLQDPQGRPKDEFGRGVAICQTIALIGAPESDLTDDADDSGKVLVFSLKNNQWNIIRTLTDGETGDYFGWSVAIDVSFTAVVGAYRDSSNGGFSGAIYVFEIEIDPMIPQGNGTKIVASNAHATAYFGYSVAISQDDSGAPQIIVGAYGSNDVGQAFVYRRDVNVDGAWIEVAILSSDDSIIGDRFGWSVDIFHNHAVVGAPLHNRDGAAYIYWRSGNNWVLNQKLIQEFASNTDDAMTYDFYGISVVTGDGVIAIGAPGNDIMGDEAGAVYVYVDSSFQQNKAMSRQLGNSISDFRFLQILAAPNPIPYYRFGWSIAYDDTMRRFVIGTDTTKSSREGTVYVYHYEDNHYFKFETALLPKGDTGNTMFGISCDVYGDHILVGAVRGNGITSATGTAYHFHAESRSEWVYIHTAAKSGSYTGAVVTGVILALAFAFAFFITGLSFRHNLRDMVIQMTYLRDRQRFSGGQELVSTSDFTVGEEGPAGWVGSRLKGGSHRDTSIDVSNRPSASHGDRELGGNTSDLEIVHLNMDSEDNNVTSSGAVAQSSRAMRLKSSLKKNNNNNITSNSRNQTGMLSPPPTVPNFSTSSESIKKYNNHSNNNNTNSNKKIVPLTLL